MGCAHVALRGAMAVCLAAVGLGLAGAAVPQAQVPEAKWLPVGALAFRFGEDGKAALPETRGEPRPTGWVFYGPTGTADVSVTGIRREWMASLADAASLTEPPRERRLAIALDVGFDASGGGRFGWSCARVETGLVDEEGNVVAHWERQTSAYCEMSFSPYVGRSGRHEDLILPLEGVPEKLPERGYVRADVVDGAGCSYYGFGRWGEPFTSSYGDP